VTGQVAETLQRKWIGIEINPEYVAGSKVRFSDQFPAVADAA
jgi:site-specific DNA-methyltransferase (cytosine-N4-specific)